MTCWRGWLFRLRALLHKEELEQELDEELRFHLEMQIAAHLEAGMTLAEARTEALRSFGGVEKVKEECREARGLTWLEGLWQDLRYACRILTKRPGFTLTVLAVLALGIGANTAIFSIVNGVLLQPLPYASGRELVLLRQRAREAGIEDAAFSVQEFFDYRNSSPSLAALVEYHSMWFNLLGKGEPLRVQTGVVSANFFDVLGVRPLLGRTFLPHDEEGGAEAVLVLSYDFWQRLGADRGVVGRTFEMNDKLHKVVGILPPIPQYPDDNDVYMPSTACPFRGSDFWRENRDFRPLTVFGRLASGATLQGARAELQTVARSLQEQHGESYPAEATWEATAVDLREELVREARPTFLILLGTVGLVLLISCANVANLTLARLLRRERELAVRAALGAGRGRLVRQLLTESILLSLVGGGLGLLLALAGLDLLVAFAGRFTPRAHEIGIDGTVLLFAVAISALTGIIFGAVPALQRRRSPVPTLKDGSGWGSRRVGGHRVRDLLVVAQVAVSFVLLIGAGLMARSLLELQQVDPGFDPHNVLTVRIDLDWNEYTDAEAILQFHARVLERVRARPEVTSAAVAFSTPLDRLGRNRGEIRVEGRAQDAAPPTAELRVVGPGYFRVLNIPVLQGRAFQVCDDAEATGVVIVNRSTARAYWRENDPVGDRISVDGGESWLTVVGVVADVKHHSLDEEPTREVYLSYLQNPTLVTHLVVRAAGDPLHMARHVRAAVREVDASQPLANVRTLLQRKGESLASPRLTTTLLGLFALLALGITAAGIGGVLAFSVSQRAGEIGVRMALGARRWTVLEMVLRQGVAQVLTGLAIGLVGSLALSRLMVHLLYAVQPGDPLTFGAVAMVLLLVSAAACYIPARRAATIDPVSALRSE